MGLHDRERGLGAESGHVKVREDHVPRTAREGRAEARLVVDALRLDGEPSAAELAEQQQRVLFAVFDEQRLEGPGPDARASVKKKVAPSPTALSAQIRPPWRVTMRSTVARPTPVPSNSRPAWSR